MSDLTSEKIAKALKGAGLSTKQRIEKAREAWTNDSIFFPNKDDFLFDWICSAFAKPNMKKLDDCCLLQLPYWTLLADLLQHYVDKVRLDPKRSIPSVHANIVLSVSTLLQQLDKSYADLPDKRAEFLEAAYRCLDILFSDDFALSYRPAFEHVSSSVNQILSSLTTQIDLCNKNKNAQETKSMKALCQTAQVLLKKHDSQLVLAANQKKIFSSVVEKSLTKLLAVRRRISLVQDITTDIADIITEIVCHALFHADTVLEYTSVLKDINSSTTAMNGNIKQTNYVVKAFDTLEDMVTNKKEPEQMLDAVDVVPTLLSAFLSAFRQKRNTSTSAMQDVSRMAEFGMFVYLLKIINNIKERSVSAYLESLCRLLKTLLQWNVYSARNDDIAKSQQDVLNAIADDVVGYLDDSKRYDQGLVLGLADTLLQIDLSLIENRIQALWPIMVNPKDDSYNSCLEFAKSVLNTYSASRQIDVFISDLIKTMSQVKTSDVYSLLKKPMFTKDFLNVFGSSIAKSMPAAQALGIFSEMQKELVSNVFKPSAAEPASKKQKKKAQQGTAQSGFSTLPLAIYLVEFTNSLRLTQHQLHTFESAVLNVFQSFIKPSISAWIRSKENAENTILPAMQLHAALSTVFFEVYTVKIEKEDLKWLAEQYIQIFQACIEIDTLGSRIATVACANSMLQHAYYASLTQEASIEQTTTLTNAVIDYVTSNNEWHKAVEWSGSVLELNSKDTVKLACWKLLSDEWFESATLFIDDKRAERVADVIFKSLINDNNSSTNISAQVLSKTLLRTASFYEAKCFKDCNVNTILNTFVHIFKNRLLEASVGELPTVAAKMIVALDTKKPIAVDRNSTGDLIAAIKKKEDVMEQDATDEGNENINKIATLMKLLLLFPNEYYEKNERPQILYLATLVDIWSINSKNADPVARIKVSLMCRTLHLRFMGYFSANSILGSDSVMLDWLIMSSQELAIENTNLVHSLENVTNEIDLSILRKTILNAAAKNPEEQTLKYLQDTSSRRVKDLDKGPVLFKLINLLRAINSALSGKKITGDIDLDNVTFAVETVSKISKYIIASLKRVKNTIETVLNQVKSSPEKKLDIITENTAVFNNIKYIFVLTRLLQEYARILGPNVDQVMEAEELSKTLTALASPFIQFLQSALVFDKTQNHVVLNMTTEFIAAFCSILSRYQQIDTTKHVLAAIWFVYSLVFSTGDKDSLDVLSDAFASWVQSLSKDQYTIVFKSFEEQAEDEAIKRTDKSKEQHHLVFLSLLSQLVAHCADNEKGRLRKQIPSLVLKISLIAGKTESLEYLQQMLKLLIQLTSDQSYHFSDYDASLVLSCLLQISHPTAPDRLKGQMNKEKAHTIFMDVCSVLSNLISRHKKQIVYMMPPFVALVQSLLHCFKSTHVSLVNSNSNNNRKRKYTSTNEDNKKFACRTVPLLYEFTPLDDNAAQRYARVLTTIPQKQYIQQKSTQPLQKVIAKHTPSILIEFFTIQANPTMSVVNPSTKSILTNALYEILDMCSESDRTFILSCLDGPGKALFKTFYNNWKDNHKYSGQ